MLKMVDKEEESVKHITDIVREWGQWQKHLFWYCFVLSAFSALNNIRYILVFIHIMLTFGTVMFPLIIRYFKF